MRKLIWCGVTGLAVVAGGYRVLRHAEAWPGSDAGRLATSSRATLAGHQIAECNFSTSTDRADGCLFHESCTVISSPPESASVADVDAPPAASGVIELQGSGGPSSAVIYIPSGDEPPPALPEGNAVASAEPAPPSAPAVMPYCDDDAGDAMRMPYAADDPWSLAKPDNAARSPGWFEGEEPEAPATIPECREDDSLSQQYPALPSPPASPIEKTPKKAMPWRHEGEPFLPVPPEVENYKAPWPGQNDGKKTNAVDAEWWLGSAWQYLESVHLAPSGLRKHVSLKIGLGRDNENAARQPVDTLEARPSDLPRAEHEPSPF